MEIFYKTILTPSQHKIMVAYITHNHRVAKEIGRWLTLPINRDTRLCHFCSYSAVDNEAHVVLKCSLSEITFHHYSECNVKEPRVFLLDGAKVDINLYLRKATTLHHSRELAA